jgi:hypothetical protein
MQAQNTCASKTADEPVPPKEGADERIFSRTRSLASRLFSAGWKTRGSGELSSQRARSVDTNAKDGPDESVDRRQIPSLLLYGNYRSLFPA